jgi:transposase
MQCKGGAGGETGQKILRAIVEGEHDGRVLAAMKNTRIHASEDDIAKSLQGNWRAEHLFALKQALALFDINTFRTYASPAVFR